jgi:hypothetical protein
VKLEVVSPGAVGAELAACMEFLRRGECDVEPGPSTRLRANDELVVVEVSWIGCVGLLVHRESKSVFQMDSPTAIETYLWAYERGMYLGGENVLAIDRVMDLVETRRVLMRALRGRAVLVEIVPLLSAPVSLYVGWDAMSLLLEPLEQVEQAGAPFCFRLNPSEPPAVRWPANATDDYIKSPWARRSER